jgi:hypothetical protein
VNGAIDDKNYASEMIEKSPHKKSRKIFKLKVKNKPENETTNDSKPGFKINFYQSE